MIYESFLIIAEKALELNEKIAVGLVLEWRVGLEVAGVAVVGAEGQVSWDLLTSVVAYIGSGGTVGAGLGTLGKSSQY